VDELIHRNIDPGSSVQVLPGGETIEIDGSTVVDPETGQPAPAAVLRLPVWRMRELAAALDVWTRTLTLVTAEGAHLPTEGPLSAILHDTANAIAYRPLR
jgi:hypothetical protein